MTDGLASYCLTFGLFCFSGYHSRIPVVFWAGVVGMGIIWQRTAVYLFSMTYGIHWSWQVPGFNGFLRLLLPFPPPQHQRQQHVLCRIGRSVRHPFLRQDWSARPPSHPLQRCLPCRVRAPHPPRFCPLIFADRVPQSLWEVSLASSRS